MTTANGNGLSDRSAGVLAFILDYHHQRRIAPTYREIGAACNITTTSLVKYHLDKLEAAGYIERFKGVARGIIPKPTPEAEAAPAERPATPEAEPSETVLSEGVGYAGRY